MPGIRRATGGDDGGPGWSASSDSGDAARPRAAQAADAMTLGASLFTIAVGAILRFAVTATVAGIDIQVVGTILMVVGVIGLAFAIWQLVADQRRESEPPRPPSSRYY